MKNQEEELFRKRLLELADKADRRNIPVFTDFLNLNELNIFHGLAGELSFVEHRLWGGYENAERQMIAFFPDALLDVMEDFAPFPIACLQVSPLNAKFAEELTHRDYLGAILNLGIERSAIGDILPEGDHAWIFCTDRMADFLCRELGRVRHTSVRTEMAGEQEFRYQPRLQTITGSVASVRLDSLLSLAFSASRSSLVGLIEGGKVFVDGRLVTSNGYRVKEGDLISARGLGRFRYVGAGNSSRKGRLFVTIERYV